MKTKEIYALEQETIKTVGYYVTNGNNKILRKIGYNSAQAFAIMLLEIIYVMLIMLAQSWTKSSI